MDTIDAIIAEGMAPVAAQEQPKTEDAPLETQDVPDEPEAEDAEPEADKLADDKPDDMFPKKAVNALSRRDKQIGRLKAEKQAMLEELESLRQKTSPKPEAKNEAPNEADFEGKPYGDYLKAVARYEARQEFNEAQAKQSEKKAENDNQSWIAERSEALDDNAEVAKEAFNDFDTIVNKAIPKEGLAPHVKRAFLEADNGAFALYALAKEGTLEDLNDLSPTKVAMTIARMEDKGLALSKKQTTKAPTPISPAKGTAAGGKSPEKMSADELMKWVYS